ncbi:MAG: TolC family protein, partial [Bacteroidota bacterium]|nr:TolC family protein [Bacteroidota bacterium]
RIYDLEIEKKKAELESLRRGLLPQFGIYSNYIWYANHPSQVNTSAQYIKPRNFIVGLAVTIPLFEGFKSPSEIEKAKLELERLKVEKRAGTIISDSDISGFTALY